MNFFRKIFGKGSSAGKETDQSLDVLHLWEDDYLMIELLPFENLEFVKKETQRINNFGQEHFDGQSFTEITPIGEKPFNTIEKLIDISEIEDIIAKSGLEKISQFHMQDVGLLTGDKAPLGFGGKHFAIICDKQSRLLKHIWLTGHTKNDEERQKLITALKLIGSNYNFIGVDWFKCEYYNLVEDVSVKEFVETSC
jgi:hypothetical protein